MAKKAYIGVSGVARKVKKGYIGVDGKARKIKKAYIGIGGVARPCWSGGELAYYGKLDAGVSNSYVQKLAAASNENYALFAGGNPPSGSSLNTVTAYNKALTVTSAPALSQGVYDLAGTSFGKYAVFGGGYAASVTDVVEAYDGSLVKTKLTTGLTTKATALGASSVGNYAFFVGGSGYRNALSNQINVYNNSLSKVSFSGYLTNAVQYIGGTHVGDYAVFGGGNAGGNAFKNVDVVNTSLTQSTASSLTGGGRGIAATNIGNYAVFGGGSPNNATAGHAYVNAYNASLTRSTLTALSASKHHLSATTVNGAYVLFSPAITSSYLWEAYDVNLTKVFSYTSEVSRGGYLGLASIGDYAIAVGGVGCNDIEEAFVIA